MYIANYPEDSVLRRHCDATAALDLQQWLEQGPADAVLRRHWHQLQMPAAEAPLTASTEPASRVRKGAAAVASESPARTGFFAWLGRLFRR
jgi:hypothetical protein